MTNKHGDFIWYELMTSDAGAAQEFYSAVLGWSFGVPDAAAKDYREFSMNGVPVGGVMPLTPEMTKGGARPVWAGYINVEDVDRMAEAITSANGSMLMEPQDIDGVGRFALVADPQGAIFYVMKPIPPVDNPDAARQSFAATEPMVGHCAWNELATSDPEMAINFYHDLFGWTKDGEMDMGPTGKYEFLKVGDDRGFMIGAVMPKMAEQPVSMWTYYFRVPDIDKAADMIKAKAGRILQEPTEIPGGDYSLVGVDPQDATFGLIGPRP